MSSAHPPARRPERRSGRDRRQKDTGPPPGIKDRRTGIEPRRPDVSEVDLTPSDWANFDALEPLQDEKAKKRDKPPGIA